MSHIGPYRIRVFSKKFCLFENDEMELSKYGKLFSIHFWRGFSNYFSLELNKIHIIIIPLIFGDINLPIFAVFMLRIKMFEIVHIR